MEYWIEQAKAADAEAVLAFTRRCGAESDNLSFGAEGIPIPAAEEAAFLASLEHSDRGIFLLARTQDGIIGTASYAVCPKRRASHRGEFGLCVAKAYWNRGVGTALLQRILAFAKDRAGSEIVSAEVRSDNRAAIRLYERFGFEKIGTFRGYFKIGGEWVDFDIMELFL